MRRLMRRTGLTAALGLLLTGCVQTPETGTTQPRMDLPQNCDAEMWKKKIGEPVSAIDQSKLSPGTRVIGPDMPVTADYSAKRLNIGYDEQGIITEVSCY